MPINPLQQKMATAFAKDSVRRRHEQRSPQSAPDMPVHDDTPKNFEDQLQSDITGRIQAEYVRRIQEERNQKKRDALQNFNTEQFAKQHDIDLSQLPLWARNNVGEAAVLLGLELNKKIEECRFEWFLVAVALAMIKDASFIITILPVADFLVPPILAFCITIILWVILTMQTSFVGGIIRKWISKRIGLLVWEFIPFLEYVPTLTIMMIWIYWDITRERKKYIEARKHLQKTFPHISSIGKEGKKKRAPRAAPRRNPSQETLPQAA